MITAIGFGWDATADTELSPGLIVQEDEEEDEADEDYGQTHEGERGAEAEGALEVDAERDEYAVGAEGTVKPAEAEGETDEYPGYEAEDGAVEYPLGEDAAEAAEKQRAVDEHHDGADEGDGADNDTAHAPDAALA